MSIIRVLICILIFLCFGCQEIKREPSLYKNAKLDSFGIPARNDERFVFQFLNDKNCRRDIKVNSYPPWLLKYVKEGLQVSTKKFKGFGFLNNVLNCLDLRLEHVIDEEIRLLLNSKYSKDDEPNDFVMNAFALFLLKSNIMVFKNQSYLDYLLYLESLKSDYAIIFGIPLLSQFVFADKIKEKDFKNIIKHINTVYMKSENDDLKIIALIVKLKFGGDNEDEKNMDELFLFHDRLHFVLFLPKKDPRLDKAFMFLSHLLAEKYVNNKYRVWGDYILLEGKNTEMPLRLPLLPGIDPNYRSK